MLDARFESKTSSFAYRICLPCQSFPSCHITRTRSILFCCWFQYLMGLVFEDYGSPNWAGSTLYPPPKLTAKRPCKMGLNAPKRKRGRISTIHFLRGYVSFRKGIVTINSDSFCIKRGGGKIIDPIPADRIPHQPGWKYHSQRKHMTPWKSVKPPSFFRPVGWFTSFTMYHRKGLSITQRNHPGSFNGGWSPGDCLWHMACSHLIIQETGSWLES